MVEALQLQCWGDHSDVKRLGPKTNFPETSDHVSVSTMHLAKGFEIQAGVLMACDYETLRLQLRIEAISDEADLQEVYDTEWRLLCVACTRARD